MENMFQTIQNRVKVPVKVCAVFSRSSHQEQDTSTHSRIYALLLTFSHLLLNFVIYNNDCPYYHGSCRSSIVLGASLITPINVHSIDLLLLYLLPLTSLTCCKTTQTLVSFLALVGQMNICAIPRFNP